MKLDKFAVELPEIERLERENRELKQQLGRRDPHLKLLMAIRAVNLRNENKCIRDILQEFER